MLFKDNKNYFSVTFTAASKSFWNYFIVLLIGSVATNKVFSKENNYDSLDQQFYEEMTTIASGYLQDTETSPSTVSVITSKDIEKIGAITLEEVLETIPGIHVNWDNGFSPSFNIRGVSSTTNSQVLIYLDGISINSATTSSSRLALSRLVRNVERIEIIKGPGSALYGADAFSGVINIITKKDIGTDSGAFAGSLDTFGGWLNHGVKADNFKFLFSAQGRTTNGSKGIIQQDRQTQFDRIFGAHASLAPGPINRGHDSLDFKLEVQYKDTGNLYLRYIKNKDFGLGGGLSDSLDNDGVTSSNAWMAGLKYTFGPDDWKTTFNADYTGNKSFAAQNIFPAGAFGGLFKEPVKQKFGPTTHSFRTGLKTIYERLNNHKTHIGLGFDFDSIDNIKDKRNFRQLTNNLLFPAGSFQSVQSLGEHPIILPQTRYTYYGYFQDEWQLLNDLALTAGVRVDYFSDFGWTVNPRASLVWNASPSLTTKLMYGRAFRAPSFFELYTKEGIAVTGNPDLDPETMEMLELSIEKRWPFSVDTQLNLFWYKIDDLIAETRTVDPATRNERRFFVNSSGATTYGLETILKYQATNNFWINFNYTYLKVNPDSQENDQFIATTPRHEVYAEVDWMFLPQWTVNIRSTSVLDRKRPAFDNRLPIKDYTKLDFTLSYKGLLDVMDITFKINNLTDTDVRDPSIDGKSIPFDYPLNRRYFMGIISLNL